MSIRRLIAIGSIALVSVTGIGAGTAAEAATQGACYSSPSQTCLPRMSTNWRPWSSSWSPGANQWTISSGTRVDMRCWTTGATQLGTAKWFYVISQAYPYTRGYVPANAVSSQITVRQC